MNIKLINLALYKIQYFCINHMQVFEQMNRKLDEGWKLTNSTCEECKSVIMLNPKKNTLVCITGKHENLQKPFESSKSESSENEFVELAAPVISNRQKSDQISKKLGQKLIQGWAMLEDSCQDCNVPIMRSKKGEMICYGCNKQFKKDEPEQTKIQNNSNKPTAKQATRVESLTSKKQQAMKVSTFASTQKSQNMATKNQSVGGTFSDVSERILLSSALFIQKQLQEQISRNNFHGFGLALQKFQSVLRLKQSFNKLNL